MTNEEIAEQLYDELQHNKIINYQQYSDRLYELLDKAHPDDERVGGYVAEVENLMHNKWSFGFCDMCEDVIFYDTDAWYDLCGEVFENERDNLEKRLPIYEKQVGYPIQDVCSTCLHKLTDNKEN